MATLLLTVLGLLLLLVALLAVPVELRFTAAFDAQRVPATGAIRLAWGFGLVNIQLTGRPRRSPPRAPPGTKKPLKRRRPRRRVRWQRLLTVPAARQLFSTLLDRLLRTIHVPLLRVNARFGLDDPADTGRLWGCVAPLLVQLPAHIETRFQPVFDEPVLRFEGNGTVRLIPLRVIVVMLSVALSPTAWRLFRHALAPRPSPS